MSRSKSGQAKEKLVRIEDDVKLDLKMLRGVLPAQMWGRKIEGDGDVVRVLVRMYKEKKIGAVEATPNESETISSITNQEFKDLEWRAKHFEELATNANRLFVYQCNKHNEDPREIREQFHRR